MGVEATVDAPPVERQIYDVNDQVNAVLAKVEPNSFTWFNPETKNEETVNNWRWFFTVMDEGPWQGLDIQGTTPTTFTAHPECKAYNWASAIAGGQFPVGSGFRSEDITGMPCRILIGHQKSKKSERVFMKVTDVMPPRASAAVQQIAAASHVSPEVTPF